MDRKTGNFGRKNLANADSKNFGEMITINSASNYKLNSDDAENYNVCVVNTRNPVS